MFKEKGYVHQLPNQQGHLIKHPCIQINIKLSFSGAKWCEMLYMRFSKTDFII